MKRIILKSKKDAPVRRFHPWVFSGAVKKEEGQPTDGDVVEVYSNNGDYLATGHYQKGSILVRLFSFKSCTPNIDFWLSKLTNAYTYRQRLGLIDNSATDCYRLIHAEGDGCPGLIIDVYGKTAIIQAHSIGMHLAQATIASALQQLYQGKLTAIYSKSKATLPNNYAHQIEDGYLLGEMTSTIVQENHNSFYVNWEEGQKTGFFLDQRPNRQLLKDYVKNKRVLNAFCYSGGFSVYALKAGAKSVDSVDISSKAIDWTTSNVQLNEKDFTGTHQVYTSDVLQFLKDIETPYEVMVVDPPAFAKSLKKRHNAVQGYKRLNALAMKKIVSGGILLSFSCSQVVGTQLFYDTLVAAALEAGRRVRVMKHLSQGADHPVDFYHPEGAYLKGLVLYVE